MHVSLSICEHTQVYIYGFGRRLLMLMHMSGFRFIYNGGLTNHQGNTPYPTQSQPQESAHCLLSTHTHAGQPSHTHIRTHPHTHTSSTCKMNLKGTAKVRAAGPRTLTLLFWSLLPCITTSSYPPLHLQSDAIISFNTHTRAETHLDS